MIRPNLDSLSPVTVILCHKQRTKRQVTHNVDVKEIENRNVNLSLITLVTLKCKLPVFSTLVHLYRTLVFLQYICINEYCYYDKYNTSTVTTPQSLNRF